MKRIVWLASYPKSGNTWVRMLLAAYRQPISQSFQLNSAFRSTFSDSRRDALEAFVGKSNLTDAEVDEYRESYQRALAAELRPPVLVKTHNANVRHHDVSLILRECTLGAVYVVRNPLDIVDSVADHWGCLPDEAIRILGDDQMRIGGEDDPMVRQHLRSWSRHVSSWISEPAFPTHVVRYEDLHASPDLTLRNLLTFLGWKIDDKKVDNAIAATDFKKLQDQEAASGFAERSERSRSGRFFREGKTGRWKEKLTPTQVDRIIADQGEAMRRLGYLRFENPNIAIASYELASKERSLA